MASAIVGVGVLGVGLSGAGIAPGEKATFTLRVESIGAGEVTRLTAQLMCLYSGGEAPVCDPVNLAVNVPNNAAREVTAILKALDMESGAFAWMRANGARAAGDHGGKSAPGQVVLRCAWISAKGQGTADHTLSEHDVYLIDRRCAPAIQAFSLERCNASGAVDDEGEKLLASVHLSIGDDTRLSDMTCCLYYAQDGTPTEGSPCVDLTDSLEALLAGVQDSTTLVPLTVARTSDWRFLLVFGDGWEQAAGGLEISRAFANLHLSGASTGGAAFGMFGTSTEGSPKLECAYPAHFYAGIAGVNHYRQAEEATGGTWIDGRPVYRRVLAFTITQTNAFVEAASLIQGFGGFGAVIGVQGCVVRKTGGKIMPLMFWQASNNLNSVHFTDEGAMLVYTTAAADFYVVVEYTKGSDPVSNNVSLATVNRVTQVGETM